MLWMLDNGIAVSDASPQDICSGRPTRHCNTNSSFITGYTEDDKLANVYDLLGCAREYSMELFQSKERVARGGSNEGQVAPSHGGSYYTIYDWGISSRLVLYT